MGEVDYADAAYHRESTGNATSLPPPPISGSRPPVPVALPKRRASVQTSKSTGNVEAGFTPSRSQSEYMIEDERHSLEEGTSPGCLSGRHVIQWGFF